MNFFANTQRIYTSVFILAMVLTSLITFQNCSQNSFKPLDPTVVESASSKNTAELASGSQRRAVPSSVAPSTNPVSMSGGIITIPILSQAEQSAPFLRKDCFFNLKTLSTDYKTVELFTSFYIYNGITYQPDASGGMRLPYGMPSGVQVALANKSTGRLTDVIFWVRCEKGTLVINSTSPEIPSAVVASQGQTSQDTTITDINKSQAQQENPFYTCSIEKRIAHCTELFNGFAATNSTWSSMNPHNPEACNASSKSQDGWRADYFSEQVEYNSNVKLSGYGCAVEFRTNLCKKGTNTKITKQEWLDYYSKYGNFSSTDPNINDQNLKASLENQFSFFQARMSWYTSRVENDPQQCQPEGLKYYEYWYNTAQNIQPTLSVTRVNRDEGKVGTTTTAIFETNMSDAKVLYYECAPPPGRTGFTSLGRQELTLENGRRTIEGPVEAAWVGLSECKYEVTGSLGTATFTDKMTFISN